MAFLPTTVKEARQRGWDSVDVVLFTGDAYICLLYTSPSPRDA